MMFVFVWARSSVNPSQSFHLGNPMPSSHEPTLRVDCVENPNFTDTKGHQRSPKFGKVGLALGLGFVCISLQTIPSGYLTWPWTITIFNR